MELVIVLSLVSVLLSASASGVRNALAREEIDGRIRAIVFDLAAGQQVAMSRRTQVMATFQDQTYTIVDVNGGGTYRQETLAGHITFGGTLQTIRFDRRGIPADAGGTPITSEWTITMRSTASGHTYTLKVEPVTGRVSYSAQ